MRYFSLVGVQGACILCCMFLCHRYLWPDFQGYKSAVLSILNPKLREIYTMHFLAAQLSSAGLFSGSTAWREPRIALVPQLFCSVLAIRSLIC
jgi:hypothetical protein